LTTAHAPHSKALPELLRILSDLLEENSMHNEHVLHWNRNPEEFDFRFMKTDGNVLLEIYQYPSEERLSDEGELVYSHKGNIKDVCTAFVETFRQLYEDRNTDEFEFNWRQPFPFKEFRNFEEKMRNYGK